MMHLEVRARGRPEHPAKENAGQGRADQSIDKKSNPTMINRQKERTTSSLVDCFNCGKKGHFAAQCPDREVRINKISTSNSIMVSGKIGNKETSMLLDSSHDSLPSKAHRPEGGWLTVRGAVGEQSLQTPVVNVEMEGEKEALSPQKTPPHSGGIESVECSTGME